MFLKAKNDHSFKFNFDNYGNNSELFNDGKLRMIGDCNGQKIHYIYNQENFKLIPGSPIAYWASENLINNFTVGFSIDVISKFTGSQNITADNNKYLRYLWEVEKDKIIKKIGFFILKVETSENIMATYY